MNLGLMQTALQRYGFDTTDPLTAWINAAMHDLEVAAEWTFLEIGETSISVAAGVNMPALPSDFARIKILRDNTNLVKIRYMERHQFARMVQDPTDQGLPELYTLIGANQLQLWRVPNSPVTLGLVYEGTTPDLANSTDSPSTGGNPWPTPTHYPIVLRAAAIALMAENEEDRSQTAQKEYESMVARLIERYTNRQIDEVETVEDVQGYAGDMPIRGSIGGW